MTHQEVKLPEPDVEVTEYLKGYKTDTARRLIAERVAEAEQRMKNRCVEAVRFADTGTEAQDLIKQLK